MYASLAALVMISMDCVAPRSSLIIPTASNCIAVLLLWIDAPLTSQISVRLLSTSQLYVTLPNESNGMVWFDVGMKAVPAVWKDYM